VFGELTDDGDIMQGQPIAQGQQALSTTITANLVDDLYEYIDAGTLHFYCGGSDANVRIDLFVHGMQILRRAALPFTVAAGALDTSAHLVASVPTLGGKIELLGIATTGTPTMSFLLAFEGIMGGRILSRLFGRRR